MLTGVGGPEQLVVEEVSEPEPADGQAIVDVRAAGINFADVLIRPKRSALGMNVPGRTREPFSTIRTSSSC